ncbi:hypothetical protein CDCA_CDCA07G2041 [Cyanidium caldarium]|uniref:Uncharacterized protein n=1 Tax=Cyanidium caldarium TaxID=2771 RepID=A0AAV9IV32_CYACA|nr:hypothetical protein CDCA_CDCA07G2041 [Cyanidium caldarium]
MQDALRGLESAQRVEQERALQAVRAVLPAAAAELEAARGWCERVLDAESPCWASVCGVFRLGQLVLEQQFGRGAAVEDDALAKRQWQSLMERGALLYMEHTEARVRQAAMAALAAVVRCDGDDQVLRRALPLLLSSVERNLPRKVSNGSAEGEGDASSGVRSATESADTGWHALETSLNGAAECVVALSAAGVVRLAPDLERLFAGEALQHCRRHPNRFVREADLRLVESVLRALTQLPDDAAARRTVTHVADSSLAIIAAGLADNWSQVRYMASKAARALYQVQRQSGAQHGDRIDRVLVPRMCLNRHYVAEGVRQYSQENWVHIFGHSGRELLAVHIRDVMEYFEAESEADNHAVREAACQSIAEVFTKLDAPIVAPYVSRMLRVLMECFRDDSWPVRDCACTACASMVRQFGVGDLEAAQVDALYELWFAHCADNIPSVRQHAAEAVVSVAVALGEAHVQRVLSYLGPALRRALQQSSDAYYSESDATPFDAQRKLARDNDPHLHTGQTMYSCGSLAPKMRPARLRVGCMNCAFSRPPEPWEETDGALMVWGQLVGHGYAQRCVADGSWACVVRELALLAGFAQVTSMLTTLWTQVALAVPHLPLNALQEHQEALVAALRRARRCGHARTESAATDAARALRARLGVL